MTDSTPLHCQYVQEDMVYAGIDCTADVAIKQLGVLLGADMRQKLLEQEPDEETKTTLAAPILPAYLVSRQWRDGGATLNLFCEKVRWSFVWDVQMRRWQWLPFFMKGFSTELAMASLGILEKDIAWLSTAELKDVPTYFLERE